MTSAPHLLLSCATWYLVATATSVAQSPAVLSADIAPQPLPQALAILAQQTGLQLIYVSAVATAQRSKGARAGLSLSRALTQLLEDTGLLFEFLNPRTVKIYAPPVGPPLTQVVPVAGRHLAPHSAAPPMALEEVVVTATRREESASKVPISMAVWTPEAMEASGVKGMTEIGALTPGVEFDFDSVAAPGLYTTLVIRGVTGMHGTTTGVYIDDTPLPAARGDTFGRSFPWAFDLERVEVLRGPQATLLGQGTLGGAVRFIMNQPSLTTFSGLARTEFSTTVRGDPSYEAGAAAGGPLITDALGFRVSGWYRTDGGFVNRVDPATGATLDSNSNRQSSRSVRAALTWAPRGSVSITPSVEYDSFSLRDSPAFLVSLSNPQAGELENGLLTRQPFNDTFYLASLRLKTGFGIAELSGITSYFHRTVADALDWGSNVSYADAATLAVDLQQTMFSQEARLTSSNPDATLTWIAGAFYSSARKREASRFVPILGPVQDAKATTIGQDQLEGFGQIGLRITKRLAASAGLRLGRSTFDAVTEVPPIIRLGGAETANTPQFNVSYDTDAGNLFYATIAKGYRSGGVYPPLATCGDDPLGFPPDAVWSYEIGAKHNLLGGRVHVEASVFHIRWNNDQPDAVLPSNCGSPNTPRVSAASNGFELLVQALPTERFKPTLVVAYTDARYTQTLKVGEAVIVRKGDALGLPQQAPSPWNVTASIEYSARLMSDVKVNLRAEDTFHSRNPGPFLTDAASPFYIANSRPDPSTSMLNVRTSVRWPRFELALFVNNALDSQPALRRRSLTPSDPSSPVVAATFRPRTIGLSGTWRFDTSRE
jgi:iron complex outermembrane receptor protein